MMNINTTPAPKSPSDGLNGSLADNTRPLAGTRDGNGTTARTEAATRVKFNVPPSPVSIPMTRVRNSMVRSERGSFKRHDEARDVGIAPLHPQNTPNIWTRRTRKQKIAIIAGGALLAVGAITGIAVGVTRHDRPPQSYSNADGGFGEEFNSALNIAQWTPMNNTFTGGAYRCGYTTDAIKVGGGQAQMEVIPGNYSDRAYGCAQVVHTGTFLYGLFSADLQAAPIAGVVTALYTYTDSAPNQNQEIDIEITGGNVTRMWATAYADGIENTTAIALNFDATQSVHKYAFDWRPDSITWSVDGIEVHRLTDNLPAAVPTQFFFSTWLRAPNTFAGQYDPARAPITSHSRFEKVAYTPLA